jgi:diguanylate cyclase (GGDEF)-like protein
MRAFNGKPIRAWMFLLGPAIWVCAGLVPGFVDDFPARMILSSIIIAAAYGAAAVEVARVRDGLRTRDIAAAVLAGQALFVLLRIPVVIVDSTPGMPSFVDSSWFSISALESAIFVQVMSFLMISLTKERVEHKLRDAALTDSLTGLGNRRAFFDWTTAALARSARSQNPVATVLFDLDRFKEINDRFGHPVGDAVIQVFADAARGRLRAGDFVARLGGEEFAIALPDTTGEQAAAIAHEISAAFTADVVKTMPPGVLGSASAGVAETGQDAQSVEDMLTAADRALYEAKAVGRGAVRLAVPPSRRNEAA